MSLEGIGEAHFVELIRRHVLRDYVVLPPGTVLRVDMVVSKHLALVEVEDTLREVYSGTKQLASIAQIALIHDADFLLIAPFPQNARGASMPITYFFREMQRLGVRRKELWLVMGAPDYTTVVVKLKGDPRICVKPCVREVLIERDLEEMPLIGRELEAIARRASSSAIGND